VSLREQLIEEKILKRGWKKMARALARENKLLARAEHSQDHEIERLKEVYAEERKRVEEVVERLIEERDYLKVDVRRMVKDMITDRFPAVRKDPSHNAIATLNDGVDSCFDSADGPDVP